MSKRIVICVYPAMAAIAYQEDSGQFTKVVGEFKNVESAARELRAQDEVFIEKREILVENRIFPNAIGQRWRVVWAHGDGVPESIHLQPV